MIPHSKVWRIFVLTDTHNRLPENVKEMAKDADEIWHLGDVCTEVSPATAPD